MILNDSLNFLNGKKGPTNEPPGTLSYNGKHNNIKIRIECIEYNKTTYKKSELTTIKGPFDKDKVYWFNIIGLHDVGLIEEIGNEFQLHPMDLEDIVHVSQWSKIEINEVYLFSIFKMMYLSNAKIIHEHLGIVQYDNILLTFQETSGDVFDNIRKRLENNHNNSREYGSNFLFYSLIDALVDQYFEILTHLASDIKNIEIKIYDNDLKSRENIYYLRKELLHLLNSVTPIKDSIKSLVNKEVITKEMLPYYNDLLDHLNQISDALRAYKEMTNSLHEMQMANASNEMNKTMMTLTIFSAIFIPLSFLAGVFGMNFTYMPGLDSPSAFYIFIATCLIIAVGMLLLLKRKKKWD